MIPVWLQRRFRSGQTLTAEVALHSPDRFKQRFILAACKYFFVSDRTEQRYSHSVLQCAPGGLATPVELAKAYQNLIRKMPEVRNNPSTPAISFDSGGID
ncbi:hypothetical protein [Rhizobium jaguaris]|uniref:hypothetical protein n=1 Tax=Rhizobium jaguaris TaxID=1312183 RepID=UPI0013C4B22C|nr:hypothetical protein [Rhizobium jaguaris]